MPTPSSLQKAVDNLIPQLHNEIGANQDDINRVNKRLGRVPDALLHNGAKAALVKARAYLDSANDSLLTCLSKLSEQYPGSDPADGKRS